MCENVQFVLLGDGDYKYTSFFKAMAQKYFIQSFCEYWFLFIIHR